MLVLIRREIEDNIVMFLIAAIAALILSAVMIAAVTDSNADHSSPAGVSVTMLQALVILLPISAPLAAVFALAQGYSEGARKTATFLATRSPTRMRILAARLSAGLILICVVVAPVAVTVIVLLKTFQVSPLCDVHVALASKALVTTFLLATASYCVALRTSLNAGVVMPVGAAILIPTGLISVAVVNGFGGRAMLVYLVVIVASLVLARRKFLESPL